MRVPISWLGECVDLPEDVTIEHVHAALVRVGFEEEDVHTFDLSGPVVVGQVLSFDPEPQSNGKTINWCQVDVGEAEPRGIVCGAHNFAVGDKVVVSLPGAVLPGPFPIAARKTYGHTSDGMIASARELGLGEEHDGILLLKNLGLDPEVGVDAISLLGLDDFAVEINVTPDRGYALSIRGVAREYSHSTGAAFTDPATRVTVVAGSGFSVSIVDDAPIRGAASARVFTTRVVRGVDATLPSPPWMVARLALAGIRSISLVVDITNYAMVELGQPIHAYDLDRVAGALVVRRATSGETVTTLDDQVRVLHPEDLVIADDSGAIGLAGVMGGASTEIGDTTTNVLVEAANFDPISIARTARRHKLQSEASRRFERGVDPKMSPVAAARVIDLLVELAGGTADSLGSFLDNSAAPTAIDLPASYIERLIGVQYSADEITSSLVAVGCAVLASDTGLAVTPPTWRPDLDDRSTLAEEVARIIGYDRIPAIIPVAPPGRGITRSQRLRRAAATNLAAGGATEVVSYPFLPKSEIDAFGSAADTTTPAISIANALDAEAAYLRTSLLPGLIEIARRNLSRGLTDLALFEVGTVFQPVAGAAYGSGPLPIGNALPTPGALTELTASIPPQPWHVAGLFVGNAITQQPGQADVASGIADALASVAQLGAALAASITVKQDTHRALHPGRTASLWVADTLVGYAGELLPQLAAERDLPRVVGIFEVDLDVLITLATDEIVTSPVATMPAATQDLSLVVKADVPAATVLSAVIEGAGPLLENARLVNDYRGAGVADGAKSLTFALRFRAPDRTLTAAEATEAKNAAAVVAGERCGAELRQ